MLSSVWPTLSSGRWRLHNYGGTHLQSLQRTMSVHHCNNSPWTRLAIVCIEDTILICRHVSWFSLLLAERASRPWSPSGLLAVSGKCLQRLRSLSSGRFSAIVLAPYPVIELPDSESDRRCGIPLAISSTWLSWSSAHAIVEKKGTNVKPLHLWKVPKGIVDLYYASPVGQDYCLSLFFTDDDLVDPRHAGDQLR